MKTVTISILMAISTFASAQTLEQIASKLNRPMPTVELRELRNQAERLCVNSSPDWLDYYYVAYADIELSFRTTNEQEKTQYLNDAQNYLSKIADGDRSEISTLQGYWYFALMALDPRVNGPKYASSIISCYEKALKINPDNPRAILLYAIFKNRMEKSMGGEYKELSSDIERAQKLFNAQDTLSKKPYWGGSLFKLQ